MTRQLLGPALFLVFFTFYGIYAWQIPLLPFEQYEVVDMHLHTGRVEGQVPDGVSFLLSQLPVMALMAIVLWVSGQL